MKQCRRRMAFWFVGGSIAAATTIAISLRPALGQGNAVGCTLSEAGSADASGRIERFLLGTEADAMLARTERQKGGPINPIYKAYRAVLVVYMTSIGEKRVGVRIPTGMDVKIGDNISFRGSHRDPKLPCSYVPNVALGRSR